MILRSATLGACLFVAACGARSVNPDDPMPADSVDVPPRVPLNDVTLRPPAETPDKPGSGATATAEPKDPPPRPPAPPPPPPPPPPAP